MELPEPVTVADMQDHDVAIEHNEEGLGKISEELQQACLDLFTNWLAERKLAEARRLAILKEKEADEVCLLFLPLPEKCKNYRAWWQEVLSRDLVAWSSTIVY